MAQKVGYLIDLAKVTLNEQHESWIQAMPLGEYDHPLFGKIKFSAERVQRFADNVVNKVRGQDLDIDYDHKEHGGEAAGWVKSAQARPDGLWLLVEWTANAAEKIKQKAYRYFSPEFDDTWTHPKTGVQYQDVLFGGGITNRPFLKDILPLNLSEAFAASGAGGTTDEGGSTVSAKQVRQLLGLQEDATDDDVLTALQEKLPASGDPTDPPNGGDSGDADKKEGEGAEGSASADLNPQLTESIRKLAESSPAVKSLMDIVEAQGAELKRNSKALREAAVGRTVQKLSDTAKAKGYALPPTTKAALTEVFMEAPQQLSDKVEQAVAKLLETGLVQLGEVGKSRGGESNKTASMQFSEAVAKHQTEHKVSYADASVAVSAAQPELFAAYQAESYSNGRGE